MAVGTEVNKTLKPPGPLTSEDRLVGHRTEENSLPNVDAIGHWESKRTQTNGPSDI